MEQEVPRIFAINSLNYDSGGIIGTIFGKKASLGELDQTSRDFILYHAKGTFSFSELPDGKTIRLSYKDQVIPGLFNKSAVYTWWARAFLFHVKPDTCPVEKQPDDTDIRICNPDDGYTTVRKGPAQVMWKWVIKPEIQTDKAIIILIPKETYPIPVAYNSILLPAKILKAHYYLAEQTRQRIGAQVERQLGEGEAGRRILSTFAPEYET